MNEIVNRIESLQKEIQGSGITLTLEGNSLQVLGPAGQQSLRLISLYRPASTDVVREAAPDALLILTAATQKAAMAAAAFNHILLPDGGYRIVLPGVALLRPGTATIEESRQVRLMGRTGILAESLLLGSQRQWSVQDLATSASVSTGLSHRVMARLESEGLLRSAGEGPSKKRSVVNVKALAELWSQEEKPPQVVLRGYLYASSTEALARRILEQYPEAVVGGALAANLYQPTLTKVAPPLRLWVPGSFDPQRLDALGFERTNEGANVEFLQAKYDPWRVHRTSEGVARVSPWRAWLEIASAEGRTRELADALLQQLDPERVGDGHGSH